MDRRRRCWGWRRERWWRRGHLGRTRSGGRIWRGSQRPRPGGLGGRVAQVVSGRRRLVHGCRGVLLASGSQEDLIHDFCPPHSPSGFGEKTLHASRGRAAVSDSFVAPRISVYSTSPSYLFTIWRLTVSAGGEGQDRRYNAESEQHSALPGAASHESDPRLPRRLVTKPE